MKNTKREMIIPVNKGVILPYTEVLLNFNDAPYLEYAQDAAKKQKQVVFFLNRQSVKANLKRYGTRSTIIKVFSDLSGIKVLVRGESRVELKNITREGLFYEADVALSVEKYKITENIIALRNIIIEELKIAASLGKTVEYILLLNSASDIDPLAIAYRTGNVLEISPEQKDELLQINSLERKLERINDYLAHEIKVLDIEKNISQKTQEKINKTTKEAVLRERLEIIEKELGKNNISKEYLDLENKIKDSEMPAYVKEKALSELTRLAKMPAFNPEISYIQNYLNWLVALPWSKPSHKVDIDLKKAKEILDEDHYGLDKIKERIIEYLAVVKLKDQKNTSSRSSNILCFVGPPGVGKTSMGQSIAKALGRKFVSISLGGIRDEAEIKGHRRTYVGALPGRILQGIRQAGTSNPVFMMDEIDKIGSSFLGNPAAALLEVLDPDQNYHFSDNYLEVGYDLSSVFFITTCNIVDTIPPALKDRLEIINFSGYTELEKFNIAKKFLVVKQLEANGLRKSELIITDRAMLEIIRRYTQEAGVRNLEREIAKICRKVATKIVEKKISSQKISPHNLKDYLGTPKFKQIITKYENGVGIASGLAWSENGGVVLPIEVALMPGKGELILTGQLGNIMKESCMAALSFYRSKTEALGLDIKFFKTHDVHIHVPEGAVQKDGPSAGIAIATALFSALARAKIKKDVGLSGEITPRGRVLEVGGVKEKVIAAQRSGIKTVVLPVENRKDEEEIPDYVLKKINLIYVRQLSEGLEYALINDKENKGVLKKL